MASKLSDFTVKINLDGWYIAGYNTLGAGQLVNGNDIHPRMIVALKNKETFHSVTGDRPVCELLGGSIEELERVFAAPAAATPVVSKSAESLPVAPAAPAPTVQPPMAPPSVKPVRTPRPKPKAE